MPREETKYLQWCSIYFKLREISEAYLKEEYDYIFYILRGGMTPAHILSHVLRCQNSILYPLDIKRHIGDEIQAQTIVPHLKEDIKQNIENKNILIVEDTVGSGKTLSCALQAIGNHFPASIDVVSCGIDHKDLREKANFKAIQLFIKKVFIGFDYWGWLVFPWEKQAYDFLQSEELHYSSLCQNVNSKQKDSKWTFIKQNIDKDILFLLKNYTTASEVSKFLSKEIYTYDKPGNMIVDLYLTIAVLSWMEHRVRVS
jgi:hypoxanthine phosphoribosyltransferase